MIPQRLARVTDFLCAEPDMIQVLQEVLEHCDSPAEKGGIMRARAGKGLNAPERAE
jgi:hypothetical protein